MLTFFKVKVIFLYFSSVCECRTTETRSPSSISFYKRMTSPVSRVNAFIPLNFHHARRSVAPVIQSNMFRRFAVEVGKSGNMISNKNKSFYEKLNQKKSGLRRNRRIERVNMDGDVRTTVFRCIRSTEAGELFGKNFCITAVVVPLVSVT